MVNFLNKPLTKTKPEPKPIPIDIARALSAIAMKKAKPTLKAMTNSSPKQEIMMNNHNPAHSSGEDTNESMSTVPTQFDTNTTMTNININIKENYQNENNEMDELATPEPIIFEQEEEAEEQDAYQQPEQSLSPDDTVVQYYLPLNTTDRHHNEQEMEQDEAMIDMQQYEEYEHHQPHEYEQYPPMTPHFSAFDPNHDHGLFPNVLPSDYLMSVENNSMEMIGMGMQSNIPNMDDMNDSNALNEDVYNPYNEHHEHHQHEHNEYNYTEYSESNQYKQDNDNNDNDWNMASNSEWNTNY